MKFHVGYKFVARSFRFIFLQLLNIWRTLTQARRWEILIFYRRNVFEITRASFYLTRSKSEEEEIVLPRLH